MKRICLLCIILLFSCSQNSEGTENSLNKKSNTSENTKSNERENKDRIEKKYGKQWDFCDCVKKNDSIDHLLKQKKLSEKQLDELLLRADEIDNKCKVLLTDLNSNKPSDRAKHQAKVKACLEN